MANLKKYTTNVIGSAETLNTCPRIVVYQEATGIPSISLFQMNDIASKILSGSYEDYKGLVIPRSEEGKYEYRKDNLTWIQEKTDQETYEKRLDWGFDIIIYLDAAGNAIGYTKFSEPNGKGKTNLDIILNFSVSIDDSLGSEILIETSVSSIGKSSEYKIKNYPRVKDLEKAQSPGPSRYTCHLSGEDIDFLGKSSVVGEDLYTVDLLCSKIINPYTKWSEFTSHQVSYYGGDDVVLESWTDTHYNIVSLLKKDPYFGHPYNYTVAKEGRRPIPKYNGRDTTILYLSGKYAVCDITGTGTTKIYDTSRDIWLSTSGWAISNPLRLDNKIIDLVSSQVPYDQLAEYVPEINNLFLDLSSDIIKLYRVVGNWIIMEKEATSSLRSYRICGPMIALDVLKSELPFITFLNDSTLLYYDREFNRCHIYCGKGKTFVSPRFQLNYQKLGLITEPTETGEKISESNIMGSTLDLFRRRQPHPELPKIISGFGGLVFYEDDSNRLYYL